MDQGAITTATPTRLSPEEPAGIKRVQIGCGPHHIRPDWWNCDLRAFGGIDEAFDATQPWRWSGLLDFVYAEHFIEHLDIDLALAFLVEAGRALRPGGRIRLSTPALEWVMQTHFTFQPPGSARALDETIQTNRAFYGWGHRFLYSKTMLERILREAGYENVRFFKYGQSDTPALRGLELHDGSLDIDTQWVIEGERGTTDFALPSGFIGELEQKMLHAVRAGH